MKKLILLLSLLGGLASADGLSPEVYLNNISQRLTGQWPTPEEYDSLEQAMRFARCREVQCLKGYFKAYIGKKMETPAFYNEAVLKVYEKFSFQTPAELPFPTQSVTLDPEVMLIYRVFHDNESIDQLFTSQRLWQTTYDLGNYGALFNHTIETATPPVSTPLKGRPYAEILTDYFAELDYSGHPNVSGLFSGKVFLQRYWTTPLNANRKRSAAFFKTMLCDTLAPALERDSQFQREQDLANGKTTLTHGVRTIEEIHKDRHASQEDCRKCHSRIDPVARSMRPLELGVSAFSVPGRLRFVNALNQPQDIQVPNFHALTMKATEDQKYLDCQLNWLFTWIVGKDVDVHPLRFAEMLKKFNANGRRVKSVIEDLLLSPEFQRKASTYTEPVALKKANAVFSNCYDCHSSFLKTHGDRLKLNLLKISGKLDLANDGARRLMPPKDHYWAPTASDLKDIKNWISEGAPLAVGYAPTLTPSETQVILNQQGEVK